MAQGDLVGVCLGLDGVYERVNGCEHEGVRLEGAFFTRRSWEILEDASYCAFHCLVMLAVVWSVFFVYLYPGFWRYTMSSE